MGLFAFAQRLFVIKNGIASDTDHPASTGPHREQCPETLLRPNFSDGAIMRLAGKRCKGKQAFGRLTLVSRRHTLTLIEGRIMNTPSYGAPWQQIFVHAMLEIDSPRIASKIAAAEDAVSKRLNELPLNQANAEELQALISAINKLRSAKAEAMARHPVH